MKKQNPNNKVDGIKKIIWILSIFLFGLALSGWLSPVMAGVKVTLCGVDQEPNRNGVYRLRGHFECSNDPILHIEVADDAQTVDSNKIKVDLRGFVATGNSENTGIKIDVNNVVIKGGIFRNCKTALEANRKDGCEIHNFKAIDSSDKAIKIRGNGNTISKSFCRNAGNDCFELRGGEDLENRAEWCTAIKSGTLEEGQGFSLRGPTYVYKCSAIESSAEGFQIQEGVSYVTIEHCHAVKNALSGIAIKAEEGGDVATDNIIEKCFVVNNDQGGIVIDAGATNNLLERNVAFANGDGEITFDLYDGNDQCDLNIWENNH